MQGNKRGLVIQILVIVLILAGLLTCNVFAYLYFTPAVPTEPAATTTTEAAQEEPQLLFVSTTGTAGENYFKVEGQVKNNTPDKTCGFVQVIVEYYDASGGFITSDRAYLEHAALPPGATSPFSILTDRAGYPDFETYEVSTSTVIGCLSR